jgi:asparagine synthase (glutamine-hydrolysing)
LQWGTLGKKLRTRKEMTRRWLWGAVKRQIVRPLLAPAQRRLQRFKAPTDAWRDYSAINVAFARQLDLTHQMVKQGHDPTFSPKRDALQARLHLIGPGTNIVGHLLHEIGAAYGLEVRDPTCDPRVMSFCWSIPQNQYVRDGRDRMLIRRAMAGYLPDLVRWNRRKGAQAADIGQRIVDHRSEMGMALARLDRSELARHYLDLPRMRAVFESVQHGIDRENNGQSATILLRGLMVGLFLLRFD